MTVSAWHQVTCCAASRCWRGWCWVCACRIAAGRVRTAGTGPTSSPALFTCDFTDICLHPLVCRRYFSVTSTHTIVEFTGNHIFAAGTCSTCCLCICNCGIVLLTVARFELFRVITGFQFTFVFDFCAPACLIRPIPIFAFTKAHLTQMMVSRTETE